MGRTIYELTMDALTALILAAADEAARLQAIAQCCSGDPDAQAAIYERAKRWLTLADEAVEALKVGQQLDARASVAPSAHTHSRGRGDSEATGCGGSSAGSSAGGAATSSTTRKIFGDEAGRVG